MSDNTKEKISICLVILVSILEIIVNIMEINKQMKIEITTVLSFAFLTFILSICFYYFKRLKASKKKINYLKVKNKEISQKYDILKQECKELNVKYSELKSSFSKTNNLLENTSINNRRFIETVQYIIHSLSRSRFNEFTIDKLHISYIITNNKTNKNYLDMSITYDFEGRNTTDKQISSIFLDTSIDFSDEMKNIKPFARDCRIKKNRVFEPTPTFIDKYNVISWVLPFENNPVLPCSSFKYEFKLEWEHFFILDDITQIVIDPKNYSLNTKMIDIEIVNKSDLAIETLQFYEYTREPLVQHDPILMAQTEPKKWTKIVKTNEQDVFYVVFFVV